MTKRRFSAQQQTVLRDLRNVIDAMAATSLRLSQDVFTGMAEIVFDRGGQRYVFRCEKYGDALDNLRAAQLTITYLWRALEEYGVTSETADIPQEAFNRFFLGFTPPPDDTALLLPAGRAWHEVLGLERDASAEAIRNAFRALARVHHPDAGGDAEEFRRLRVAYEEGMDNH